MGREPTIMAVCRKLWSSPFVSTMSTFLPTESSHRSPRCSCTRVMFFVGRDTPPRVAWARPTLWKAQA